MRFWEKFHKIILSFTGLLSKVWLKLETFYKSWETLSLDKNLSLLGKTICLLGQTTNSISYHRKYNILLRVCSPAKKKKKMLKHKAELLPTNEKSLFRNEFRVNIITENLKRDFSKARKQ